MELFDVALIYASSEQLIVITTVTVATIAFIFVVLKSLACYIDGNKTRQNNNSQLVGASLPSPSFLKSSRMKRGNEGSPSPLGFIAYSHPCYTQPYSVNGSSNEFHGEQMVHVTGDNLELEKLQIGSQLKGGSHSNSLITRFSPASVTSISHPGDYSVPLWKDYPMVQKGIPSSYSYCSMPMSSYSNSIPSPPSVFRNYRSSSMATIFGGPKPLISPPKLEVGFCQSVISRPESCSASPGPNYCYSGQIRNHSHMVANSCHVGSPSESTMPIYFSSPLSRSSSQSSGFISQKGFHTPPPSTANFSAVPVGIHPPRDPEGLSLYPESFVGNHPHIQDFQTDTFPSFSSLSTYSSQGLSGIQTWSSSSGTERFMGPVSISGSGSGSGSNLNGNTCSRFARKDVESKSVPKRFSNEIRSTSSTFFSEDEDDRDEEASFRSALTSITSTLTRRSTKTRSPTDVNPSSRPPRSKSKIRSGPFIRNLKNTSLFSQQMISECVSNAECDESEGDHRVNAKVKADAIPKAEVEVTSSSWKDARHWIWSVAKQLFIILSLLLNFWVLLGSSFDFDVTQESHLVRHLIHNIVSEVVSHALIFRDYFSGIFLELLVPAELYYNTSIRDPNPILHGLNNRDL